MRSLQSILVGLDFEPTDGTLTEGSRTAAAQALWLADRTGANVEFLHSTYQRGEEDVRAVESPGKEGRAALESLLAYSGREGTEIIVSHEAPWIALTRRVLSGANDLVVVAKHEQSKREDRKLGSVSMELIRKCPSPVWVVKPGREPRHRCIVAATDLTPVGDLAVEYAAYLADTESCNLCIVHAWQLPLDLQLSSSRISDSEFDERRGALIDAARTHIRSIECVAALGERAKLVLSRTTPSRAVLEVVSARQPDLVVLGTISRGGLAGVLVGNTCERLLHRLDCSLLTVTEPGSSPHTWEDEDRIPRRLPAQVCGDEPGSVTPRSAR